MIRPSISSDGDTLPRIMRNVSTFAHASAGKVMLRVDALDLGSNGFLPAPALAPPCVFLSFVIVVVWLLTVSLGESKRLFFSQHGPQQRKEQEPE